MCDPIHTMRDLRPTQIHRIEYPRVILEIGGTLAALVLDLQCITAEDSIAFFVDRSRWTNLLCIDDLPELSLLHHIYANLRSLSHLYREGARLSKHQ